MIVNSMIFKSPVSKEVGLFLWKEALNHSQTTVVS